MSVFFTRRGKAAQRVNYVGWLESDGNSWLDTEFTPNQDTRIDIVASPQDVSDSGGFLYGAGASYNSRAFECYTTSGQYEFNYAGAYPFIGTAAVGQMLTISHDKNNVTLDIDGAEYTQSFTYADFTTPYPLALFAIRRSSVICGKYRIYQCRIYENGTLVRDMWPCYDPKGVACMYDKVQGKHYYNQGSGEFVAGEIGEEPQPTTNMVSISGTGHTTWCYVVINGTTYTSSATVAIETGTTIKCVVGNSYQYVRARVVYNGTEVTGQPGNGDTASYEFAVSTTTTITLESGTVGPGYEYGRIEIVEE